eukprot:TRINITY_DN12829_c0_g1_i2.p1 TRINITY_DN12829_c0_g1~~TRINITY_DN12829_c0_g1_i2.p1  ORF type:complete len:550 (+),score=94.62 TRINITY_DN12829_c0_g1_i2:61-1710(+)
MRRSWLPCAALCAAAAAAAAIAAIEAPRGLRVAGERAGGWGSASPQAHGQPAGGAAAAPEALSPSHLVQAAAAVAALAVAGGHGAALPGASGGTAMLPAAATPQPRPPEVRATPPPLPAPPPGAQGGGAPSAAPMPQPLPAAPNGWLTWAGCNWRHGLHNQRQALFTAALAAAASGRALQLAPYIPNVHDNTTRLRNSDLWDIGRLRAALTPLPVVEESARSDWDRCPEGWKVLTRITVDGAAPLNLTSVAASLHPRQGRRLCLVFANCWGGVLWKLREGNNARTVAWAEELLRRGLFPAAPVLAAARALVQAAGQLAAPGAQVHAMHVRAVHSEHDFLPFPYPPLLDCAAEGWPPAPDPCYDTAKGRTCQCVAEHHGAADYDDVVARRSKQGRLRPGDVIFIATNDPACSKVARTRAAATAAGALTATAADLYAHSAPAAEASRRLRSAVQRGAAELTAAALCEGFFVAACSATSSEYTIHLRAALNRSGAAAQADLFVRQENASMRCLHEAWRPTPAPSEKMRQQLRGRKLSQWLAQRSRIDAARGR